MKKCSKCSLEKPEHEFNFKNKNLMILQKSCKTCTREQIRNHYLKNRDYYLSKAHKRNVKLRISNQKYIFEYLLKNPCIDCGEKDPIVLDFDHQRDKHIEISSLIKWNYSLSKLKLEISKCVIRCANCHRRKTAKDYNWYKYKLAPLA
jgi:uncharacterized protein YjbK